MSPLQLLFGFFLGATIGWVAWKAKALTGDGALAATVTGGLIFGLGGLPWAVLLLAFFITSSGLSRLFARRKSQLNEKFSKGHRRDWAQVAANGGLGIVLILLQTAYPDETWPWLAYAGALAAVNADTWATELGTLSKASPRMITTGQKVERGTSGGITWSGTLAALLGAAVIGTGVSIFSAQAGEYAQPGFLLGVITLSGLAGSLLDSLLGATLQAIYHCPSCNKETERHPLHTCGTSTRLTRGFSWLNNDVVNFAASMTGAILAVVIGLNF